MISVVIPVLNAAPTIGSQMAALTRQQPPDDWEIVVADNGSSDRSVDVVGSFADRLPVRIIDGSRHVGRSAARNFAVGQASGELLVFIDADDVVDDEWLARLVAASQMAPVVTGSYRRVPAQWTPGDPVSSTAVRPSFGGQPTVAGGNFLIERDVFDRVGGFDESYRCRVDVELAFRLHRQGFDLAVADDAIVNYRERTTGAGQFRQQYCWGVAAARLFREYRSDVVIHHSSANSVKHWGLNLLLAPIRVLRRETRARWCATIGALLGRLVGSARYRVLHL